jgi:GNAT superfamily N-acetyltransferase
VPDLALRWAGPDDLTSIIELLEFGSLVPGQEDPDDLAPYGQALAEIAAAPGGVLVAERRGVVVGVCQLMVFRHLQHHGGRCAEIESVHVHPEQRGQGIGHALMEAAVARARTLGCYRVQLTSNLARPDAHRFYESLGFEATHQGLKLVLG